MSDAVRQAKDQGAQLLAKGKLKDALLAYQTAIKGDPKDLAARQKAAEILAKLGKKPEAINEYKQIAERYAREGQFFKATAICKVILQLDPAHVQAQASLADLYAKRMTAAPVKEAEPVPSRAAIEIDEEEMVIERGHVSTPMPIDTSALLLPGPNTRQLPGATASGSNEIELDVSYALPKEEDIEEIPIIMDPVPMAPVPAELPKIPLFSDLSRDDFMAVLQYAAEVRAFSAGEAVVKEGGPGDAMYAIVQGSVGVVRQVEGEEPKTVARMKEGDLFGEMALVSDSPRLATIVAENDVVVMEFAKASLKKIIAKHATIGEAIERFYRQRLIENLLRSSPLLHPLSADEKLRVAKEFKSTNYKPGDLLLQQGTKGEAFFMLLRGQCEVFHTTREGAEHPYPPLKEGDTFGEISVLLEQPATASVRAKSPVIVLAMPAARARELLLAHPKVKPLVLQVVNERLGRTAGLVGRLRGIGRDLRV